MSKSHTKITIGAMAKAIEDGTVGEVCDLQEVEEFTEQTLAEAQRVFAAIAQNSTIKILNAEKSINDADLLRKLGENQSITRFNLSRNPFCGKSESAFVDFMHQNQSATSVDIRATSLPFSAIEQAFAQNKSVTQLYFTLQTSPTNRSGGINEENAEKINRFLERNCLWELSKFGDCDKCDLSVIFPTAIAEIIQSYFGVMSEGTLEFRANNPEYRQKLETPEFLKMIADFEQSEAKTGNLPTSSPKTSTIKALTSNSHSQSQR